VPKSKQALKRARAKARAAAEKAAEAAAGPAAPVEAASEPEPEPTSTSSSARAKKRARVKANQKAKAQAEAYVAKLHERLTDAAAADGYEDCTVPGCEMLLVKRKGPDSYSFTEYYWVSDDDGDEGMIDWEFELSPETGGFESSVYTHGFAVQNPYDCCVYSTPYIDTSNDPLLTIKDTDTDLEAVAKIYRTGRYKFFLQDGWISDRMEKIMAPNDLMYEPETKSEMQRRMCVRHIHRYGDIELPTSRWEPSADGASATTAVAEVVARSNGGAVRHGL